MPSNIQAARVLGWASLAVGITEIAATHWLEDELGIEKHAALIRSFGVREIVAGVTILSQPGLNRTLATGLWSRVAGDAADLAVLAKASGSTKNPRGLAAITSIVAAITGVDVLVALLTQRDLNNAGSISKKARQRVQATAAVSEDHISEQATAVRHASRDSLSELSL